MVKKSNIFIFKFENIFWKPFTIDRDLLKAKIIKNHVGKSINDILN